MTKLTITYTVIGDERGDVADVIEHAVKIAIGEQYAGTRWAGNDEHYTCATGDQVPATIVSVNVTESDTDERTG